MDVGLGLERAVLSLLGLFGLYGIVRFFSRPNKKANVGKVNWSPLEAIGITIAIYFVSQIAVALLIGLGLGALGWDSDRIGRELEQQPGLQFVYVLAVEALSIAVLWVFMKRRQTAWLSIGWVRPRWKDIAYALTGFVIYFGVYTIIVFNLFTALFPQVDTEQQQQLGFSTDVTGAGLLFILISLVILPPLVEEILVRGFLFTGLKNRMPFFWAAIVTSLVFGAAHLQWGSGEPLLWTAAADTFVLSMVLVWLRHKTGSLWPGITLHFIKNGLAFLALFVFKVT